MSGNYSGIFLPACSVFFSFLLVIVYFSKKRVNLIENRAYAAMLIFIFFDSTLALTLQLLAFNGINDTNVFLINIINKIDFICLIFYSNCLFLYTIIITLSKVKERAQYFKIISIIFNFLIITIMIFNKIDIISNGEYYSITGVAPMITFGTCGIYIIVSIIITLININKFDKRYIPILSIALMMILILALFLINPYLVVISISLTFINYIMYFTIENPDVKMIGELELAKNQAEKANRAKTDFLSSMSHEIRTPLNAIVGLSNIIKDSNDLNEIHEDAKDVVNASNTLLEIVNGILDISRIEADKMEIVEVSYNPLEEFKALVNLTETRIGEKEIELRSDFAVDLPKTLYGDKGKVKQIITNLLSNAVKYTEEGYIDFKVSCINENDTSKLTITVSDTGRGIKKEQMDNLFTKFNRLEEDKNTTIEGTGLGLAITKSLVEMMGGKIVVDSTYGEGSKFTIFLSQKITNDNVINIKNRIDTFDGKKVLIVDDNNLNIKVALKILKEFNLEVDQAMSGAECIEKIQNNNKYDIIFMDIMMPKMSGTEALKKLKKIEGFDTPVVALTADAIQGRSNKYLEVGFSDYLSKPIDKNELNKVLNKVLNHIEVQEQKVEKDDDIHKIIPITDEEIELLNKKLEENKKE